MLSFICSFLVAFLPLLATATLTVTEPTAAGWKGNSTVKVAWTWNATDQPFSVELGNPNIHQGLLSQGPIAVQNNVQPNTGSITFELPVLPPGSDYFVHFVNVANINDLYATSPSFSISDNPVTTTTTTTSHVSTSQSGSNTGSQTGTIATTTSNGGQTSLILSTSTSSTSPTSSHNGAAIGSFAVDLSTIMYATFVVLGATFGGAL